MQARSFAAAVAASLMLSFAASVAQAAAAGVAAGSGNGAIAANEAQHIGQIVPGQSTKADVRSLLGTPWRVVQFNDCGMAMDDQSDETWEYRGADGAGGYRLHVEFGDNNVVHLIAKIPDTMPGGKATEAKVAPSAPAKGMSM